MRRVKIVLSGGGKETFDMEVDSSLTVRQLKSQIDSRYGVFFLKIRLRPINGYLNGYLQNFKTISQCLAPDEKELRCVVELEPDLKVEQEPNPLAEQETDPRPKVEVFSLSPKTMLSCLKAQPNGVYLLWRDITKNNVLRLSLKVEGKIFLNYFRANQFCLSEEDGKIYLHYSKANAIVLGSCHIDDFLQAEDLNLQPKSLFETAVTVFRSAPKSVEDCQAFNALLHSEDISKARRSVIDLNEIPETKLDGLTLILIYRDKLQEIIKEKETQKADKFEIDKYKNICGIFQGSYDELSAGLQINNVSNLLAKTTNCLGWFYTRIINDSFAGLYVEKGLPVLGLLSLVTSKLENFLTLLLDCDREHWLSAEEHAASFSPSRK